MKKIFLLILIPIVVLAQYTNNDSLLIRTTFAREFDKNLIGQYLTSGEPGRVKAALLSISNSSDTSFIHNILSLNFSKYPEDICFTLGQLGEVTQAEDYLFNKLNSGYLSPALLLALGKCASSAVLDTLVKRYNFSSIDFEGISLSLFNFANRHSHTKEKILPILLNELRNKNLSKNRQADAAFAIYRLNLAQGLNDIITEEIVYEFQSADDNGDAVNKLYYLLGCLRLNKYYPQNKALFNKLIASNNNIIKIEAGRVLSYYKYDDDKEMNDYLALLQHSDANVSRTIAAALKELKLPEEKNDSLKKIIRNNLLNPEISTNTKVELLKSYISLFSVSLDNILADFSDYISPAYLYQAAAKYKTAEALSFLVQKYQNESSRNKLTILQGLVDYQDKFRDDYSLRHILLNSLTSDFAPLISIAADGMDSLFIADNTEMISRLVPVTVTKYKDEPDFIESIFSLLNLTERTDTALYRNCIRILENSMLSSIHKFINDKAGISGIIKINENIFSDLWDSVFQYSSAIIKTSKGNFKINFLPQYAPVTVGNFCSLASKDFFNKIIFHRVVPAFVIQAGDPTQTGWGGPGYNIMSEFSSIPYTKGIVGMASAGKDTEGSQWFVTTGYYPHLNGRYSVFAEVNEGMDIINSIDQDDWIEEIELIKK